MQSYECCSGFARLQNKCRPVCRLLLVHARKALHPLRAAQDVLARSTYLVTTSGVSLCKAFSRKSHRTRPVLTTQTVPLANHSSCAELGLLAGDSVVM